MLRYALCLLGMAALMAASAAGVAAAAGGEGPITVRVGEETDLTPNIGFSPKALSRTTYTPIQAAVSQMVRATGHPPAEREVLIELDRNLMVRTKGLPACNPRLQTGVTVDEACKGAVVGSGNETIEVAYAENTPIRVPSKVRLFNGGERNGVITLYVYGTFDGPIYGSIVAEVLVSRIRNGRLGWLADVTIPQIAGGAGSLYDLSVKISPRVLSARCTDGKLEAHVKADFEDGTVGESTIIRACTPTA